MALDAVIFDWGGTLTPWHTIDFAEAWGSYSDDRELVATLCTAESAAWARSRDEHLSSSLAQIVASCGRDLEADGLARYDTWWDEHTVTDPQAVPLLIALRERGLRIGVLSNTLWTRERHERIFARDGVLGLIDGAVYSSEIAVTKPHPDAFTAALTAVGVEDPGAAAFVGDRLFDDVWGAAAVGMRTIFVPHSDIPAEQIGHTEGEPDATVSELSQVLTVVDGWLAGR